jgi:hypothetical protein
VGHRGTEGPFGRNVEARRTRSGVSDVPRLEPVSNVLRLEADRAQARVPIGLRHSTPRARAAGALVQGEDVDHYRVRVALPGPDEDVTVDPRMRARQGGVEARHAAKINTGRIDWLA